MRKQKFKQGMWNCLEKLRGQDRFSKNIVATPLYWVRCKSLRHNAAACNATIILVWAIIFFKKQARVNVPYSAYWVSGIARHVISHQMSIFLVSQSFFLDKDQTLLFKYVVIVLSHNLVYIAVYLASSRKKEKFTQMWAYLQNVKPL